MTINLNESVKRLAALRHIMGEARAAAGDGGEAQDPSGAVTVRVDADGRPIALALDPLWKTKLDGSLGEAIMAAYTEARVGPLGRAAKVVEAAPARLADVELPPEKLAAAAAEQEDRAATMLSELTALVERFTTADIRRATDELSNAMDKARAVLTDTLPTEAAKATEDDPVACTWVGSTLVALEIDPRWERLTPADRVEATLVEAIINRPEGA